MTRTALRMTTISQKSFRARNPGHGTLQLSKAALSLTWQFAFLSSPFRFFKCQEILWVFIVLRNFPHILAASVIVSLPET